MPRTAKPPAEPKAMPRTEADFDTLLSAVEIHAECGHRIGSMVNEGQLTRDEALDEAAAVDAALYDLVDRLSESRAAQFTLEDDQLLRDSLRLQDRVVNTQDSQRRRLAMLAARPTHPPVNA